MGPSPTIHPAGRLTGRPTAPAAPGAAPACAPCARAQPFRAGGHLILFLLLPALADVVELPALGDAVELPAPAEGLPAVELPAVELPAVADAVEPPPVAACCGAAC